MARKHETTPEPDPTTGVDETRFHEQVRDALGLSPFERQEQILAEIKRLKRMEASHADRQTDV